MSPAYAKLVNFVHTVLGTVPYKLSYPVTTINLLPPSSGSIAYVVSDLLPSIYIVKVPGNGVELEPAVRDPALIKMNSALRQASVSFSSMNKSPSIWRKAMGSGLISMIRFHYPSTVTFSPLVGSLPSGHWLTLDHNLIKSSLINY